VKEMTLQFHPDDFIPDSADRYDLSTLDYLIYKIKHDLAGVLISGVNTDPLSDWCNCRNRNRSTERREEIPLVIWKYYHQAQHFFKIGGFDRRMIPKFKISMQDLNPSILRELALLATQDRNFVLKQAVAHLFEDIDSRLYHASISKLLEVELVG